jgi:hypothetical protein
MILFQIRRRYGKPKFKSTAAVGLDDKRWQTVIYFSLFNFNFLIQAQPQASQHETPFVQLLLTHRWNSQSCAKCSIVLSWIVENFFSAFWWAELITKVTSKKLNFLPFYRNRPLSTKLRWVNTFLLFVKCISL